MTTDIQNLSFEHALQQLESIVKKLEQGEVPLEDAIQYYEQGAALKAHCEHKLKSAVDKIEKIKLGENGTATTAPLDPQ